MELTRDDLSADIDLFDGRSTVTVERVDADTGAAAETCRNVCVLRRIVEAREFRVGRNASAESHAVRFHLKAADLTFVPKVRDRLTECDGAVWVVGRVSTAGLGSRYVVETVKTPVE